MAGEDEPSGGRPDLPFEYREFRRSYRWLLLFGPWALAVIGVSLIGVGLFADRPSEVALTAIGFGAAMTIAGVLLPRMRGPVELGPGGVKGAVEGLPEPLMLVAVTAEHVAEQTIPEDAPDKRRKVNEVVGQTMSEFVEHEIEGISLVYPARRPSRQALMAAMRRRAEQAARRREQAADLQDRVTQEGGGQPFDQDT
jgi:hypothetical protein